MNDDKGTLTISLTGNLTIARTDLELLLVRLAPASSTPESEWPRDHTGETAGRPDRRAYDGPAEGAAGPCWRVNSRRPVLNSGRSHAQQPELDLVKCARRIA
jgi:hypothetical protein